MKKNALLLGILILALSFNARAQVYFPEWGMAYGAGGYEELRKIVLDDDDNVIFSTMFFDSTTVTVSGVPIDIVTNDDDFILIKSDQTAAAQWYNVYPNNQYLNDIDYHGTDFYATGSYTGTMDLDPGVGTLNVTSAQTASFCQRFDNNGNLIWGKDFKGTGGIAMHDIAVDYLGNVYLTGSIYNGTVDLDPGPAVVNISTASWLRVIIKLDINGNYLWHQGYQGSDITTVYLKTSQNHVYLYGFYQGTYDFNPGVGVDNETATGNADAFLNKIDASGNLVWSKRIGGATGTDIWDRNSIDDIVLDNQENIYMVGYYASNMDVDPGAGVTTIPGFCNDCGRIFAAKWDPNGNYIWSYFAESSLASGSRLFPNGIAFNAFQNQLVLGAYAYSYPALGNIDFDPSPAQFNAAIGDMGGSFFVHLDTSGNFFWAEMRKNQNTRNFFAKGDTLVLGGDFQLTQNIGTPQSPITVTATPNTIFPFSFGEAYMVKLFYDFNGVHASVFTTPTSDIDSCDAFAFAYPIGGIPPYNYVWVSQIDTDNSSDLDSACYGIHTLLIYDAAGDSTFVDYYVTDSSNYYNWTTGTPSDTVYFVHQNCLLNYTLPIDSAEITDFFYLFDDTLSSGEYYYGEVTYYQGGTAYVFGDTVLVDFNQNVLFYLAIYCPSKIADQTKIILLTTEQPVLNLTTEKPQAFSVYPNPAQNLIKIKGTLYNYGTLTDISGRVIKEWNGSVSEVYLDDISSGIYFVSLYNQDQFIGTVKLMLESK